MPMKLSTVWKIFLWALILGWGLSTMMVASSSSCGSPSMVRSYSAVLSQELHGYLLPPNLGILLVEIHGQTWGCSLFCPVCWGPTREVNLFRLSFFQESFTVVDLSSSIDSYRYLSFLPPFLPGHIFYRGCCAHGPLRHHSTILP